MKVAIRGISALLLMLVLAAAAVVGDSRLASGRTDSATSSPVPQAQSAALGEGGELRHPGRRSFDRFLARYEAANSAFVNGDAEPWLEITSEREPSSIFGGFGGLGDAGAEAVHDRYLLAAGAFRPSGAEVDFEYLVKDVQGRTAYTVAIERAEVLYAGHTATQPHELRVTMVFRYERGEWRIAHRQADTMIDLELPTP